MKMRVIGVAACCAAVLLVAGAASAGPDSAPRGAIAWETSRSAAMAKAAGEGKLVLLLVGRETCPNTIHMRDTVCESADPPIAALIAAEYVPWFSNVDSSTEWYDYADGLGSSYTLPIIACIDPAAPGEFIDRTTARQDAAVFYARLLANSGGAPAQGQIDLNGAAFGAGSPFRATFRLNDAVTQVFDAYAVVTLPDGTMRDAITLSPQIRPVATGVPNLQAGFSYPLMSLAIPAGAPTGVCSVMVGFFAPGRPIAGPGDAFLRATAPFALR